VIGRYYSSQIIAVCAYPHILRTRDCAPAHTAFGFVL
jgi:hypothetical protein